MRRVFGGRPHGGTVFVNGQASHAARLTRRCDIMSVLARLTSKPFRTQRGGWACFFQPSLQAVMKVLLTNLTLSTRTSTEMATRDLARGLVRSGHDACVLVAECFPSTIHVLVTDLIMVKMNGQELARQFMLLRPYMQVIMKSGFQARVLLSALCAGALPRRSNVSVP
jgi:hypothetical protein